MRGGINLATKNIISQGLGTIIVLGFTVIGTRLLSVADYGELRLVMTVLPLLMAFSLPGFDSLILRNSSSRIKIPLLRIFGTRVTAASIGSLGILLYLYMNYREVSDTLVFFLLTTAALLPFFETATGYRNYLIGRGLEKQGIDLQLQAKFIGIVLALFCFGLITITDIEAQWIFPAWMLATIIPTVATFIRVALKREDGWVRQRKGAGKLNIAEAAIATTAGLVFTLSFSLDKLWVRSELGAEQLALYAILIMGPQEITKLFDSTIPIFYRKLFISKSRISMLQKMQAISLLLLVMGSYTLGFHALSGFVFGEAYTYPFHLVLLSSLLIPGLAVEYFNSHRTFAYYGASATFYYSLCSLATTTTAVVVALTQGHVAELIVALVFKQLTLPFLFLFFYRKICHAI